LPPPNAAPAPTASIDFTESDAARTQDDAGVSHAEIASTPSGPVVNLALVISYLRDLIERSKVYPVLARQRGWEGEVLLAFRVVDDGAIQSVHVARSSGNRLLDQSALQTLQHIERVTPELWRNGNDAELQLSVVYRLIKS
jgi:protein TonB